MTPALRITKGSWAILIGMILLSMIWLLPFLSVVLTALRSQGDMMKHGVFTWPEAFLWSNFVTAGNSVTFRPTSATACSLSRSKCR